MGIFIALGGNLPSEISGKTLSVAQTFIAALDHLSGQGLEIVSCSGLWESPAWPDPAAQPAYLNAAAQVKTNLSPSALLTVLKKTEAKFGRAASARNAARPLDLDILDYNGQVLNQAKLTLPHPRMTGRAFVLFPLLEIAPDWRDPVKNRTAQDWTARLSLSDVAPLTRIGFTSEYTPMRRV